MANNNKELNTEEKNKDTFGEKFSRKEETIRRKYWYRCNRITAYLIDLLIVLVLTTLLAESSITNPYKENVKSSYEEFKTVYNLEVEKIENKDLNKKDLESMIKSIAKPYRIYTIRSNFASYLWYLVILFFYLGFFQYYNNGQSLGKKFYRLKVVDKNDKKASLKQMLVRNIFGGNTFIFGNNVVILLSLLTMVFVKNPVLFVYIYTIVTGLGFIMDAIFIILFLFKKNARSLDDLIGGTKVIETTMKKDLK